MTPKPLLLSGYDAKRCARRVHNDFDETLRQPEWVVSDTLQARFDAGTDFEARTVGLIGAEMGDRGLDLGEYAKSKAGHVAATVAAMEDGVEMIIGGRLPDDVAGARTGRPDLLIRGEDRSDGRSGYVPGDIKGHRALTAPAKQLLTFTTPARPGPGHRQQRAHRLADLRAEDLLQLAHYWRMLEAAGWAAPGGPTGAIIGTDSLDGWAYTLVWHDLDAPQLKTFSRTKGTKRRSPLERYDHEFGFRVRIAEVARRRTGASDDPEPLVVPVYVDECDSCPWHDVCADLLGGDDPGMAISQGRLDVREWLALRRLGVSTTTALAGLDLDDQGFIADYSLETAHRRDAAKRLASAVARAQMVVAGTPLRRTTGGRIDLPDADIEIDLDSEWDPTGRVYLWGALVQDRHDTTGGGPIYKSFVSWQALDAAGEAQLAGKLLEWLRREYREAGAGGRTVRVYHYSHPEPSRLRAVAKSPVWVGLASPEEVDELIDATFVDLCTVMRDNFLAVDGLGLKNVAVAGAGFHWRDDDPGGLQSQQWLIDARAGSTAERDGAIGRILAYNEDDVRATSELRRWLRQ
jgi:predicted RecB family nuclease